MLVYLRDGSTQTIIHAATPREKLQIKHSTSPSHSILTQGLTSPSADPIMPGTWQGSHWSANFYVTGMTRPGKILSQAGFKLRTFHFQGERLNHLANKAVCLKGTTSLLQVWNDAHINQKRREDFQS